MRLLTHNTLKNNSAEAKGKGFPLRISSSEVRVDDDNQSLSADQQVAFVKSVLPILEWSPLVQVSWRAIVFRGVHEIEYQITSTSLT